MNQKKTIKKTNWTRIAAIAAPLCIILIITTVLLLKNTSAATSATTANAQSPNGDLVIPVSDITDKATFYPAAIDGTKMEIIAVKAPDGSIRTAFNTCQVCYSSGRGYYKQEGDELVCQNCGNRFRMDQVEVTKGGCNPVPITDENKTVSDQSITISKDFLTEAKVIFQNWKNG